MPRGGAKKGERRGGRALGTPNKKTIERKRVEAEIAQRVGPDYRPDGKKLAKDVLEDLMLMHGGLAAENQPTPGADGRRTFKNLTQREMFRYHAEEAAHCASRLAKYQSSTFKAIAVGPMPGDVPLPAPALPSGDLPKRDATRAADLYLRVIRGGKAA